MTVDRHWFTRAAIYAALLGLAGLFPAVSPCASRTRSVSGVVVDKRGNPLKGAAVQLENTVSLSIVSYITRDDGRYYFHELSTDTDFTLTAKYKRWFSKPKLLNKLDSRPTAEIGLEIPVE